MEGKGTFLIMLIVIVILVVIIAALTIFIFYGNVGRGDNITASLQEEVIIPEDDEIDYFKLFTGPKYYNLKPDEGNPSPIMQIDITLYYYRKVKGIKDVEQKITQYSSKIKEAVGLYFQDKTITEIKNNPVFWINAKDELKKEINMLLTVNEKNPDDIVYEVVFETWNYQ